MKDIQAQDGSIKAKAKVYIQAANEERIEQDVCERQF